VSDRPERGVLGLLTAQAVAFGVTLALLVIPANSLFLDAYGSKWLPATYIAIAVAGSAAAGLIARAARRTRLVRVATASLLALAVLYAASWAILVGGGVWISTLLLVLFPIALQMGFVFIGGQAGRLLDVRQLKERFPRVLTGFAVGFLLGGLLAIPLLSLLGSTEHLLLATTVAQLVFLALLLATERRFPEVRAAPTRNAPHVARPSARALFASGVVLVLLLYQVLSAMGSQVADYLLFNRAQVQYSGDELTRFLSGYTALLNLADLLFLAFLAGPLLRRFGLRLGLLLNPVVVAGLLTVMALVAAGPGGAAYALFVLAGVTRLADIVLTDGTTRTSVNAGFQVVPMSDRLAAQAFVEGVGVPVAIGATGVVLLAANLLGLGIGAVIAFGVFLCAAWTVSAVVMYGSYTRALAEVVRGRSALTGDREIDETDSALQSLLESDDARDVRLGLDLLPGVVSPSSTDGLRRAAEHGDPEVRVRALVQLATAGDSRAASDAKALAADLARSADPAARRAAAAALESRDVVPREVSLLLALLDDEDATVRSAALGAVAAEDAEEAEVVGRVVAALEAPRTAGSATAALLRLGDSPVPLLTAAIARDGTRKGAPLIRAAANAAVTHGVAVVEPALRDSDRAVVLEALDALDAAGGGHLVPAETLDRLFRDAASHDARARAALASLDDDEGGELRRALDDEVELGRRLVVAVLALRHGPRVREAVRVVDHADGQRRALGIEALDVVLSREEAAVALPLVRRGAASDAQQVATRARSQEEWIADMTDDPDRTWRSPWLALCAREARRARELAGS